MNDESLSALWEDFRTEVLWSMPVDVQGLARAIFYSTTLAIAKAVTDAEAAAPAIAATRAHQLYQEAEEWVVMQTDELAGSDLH